MDVDVDENQQPASKSSDTSCMEQRADGFGFERLDVYQRAIEFFAVAALILHDLPSGHHSLADQLRRASVSVPVNIAEGVGRMSDADQRRHYGIARGSAMECAAILSVCGILEIASTERLQEGRALLVRVVSMLTKLCR